MRVTVTRATKLLGSQRVIVSVESGRAVISPQESELLSLRNRLALYDPTKHGAEIMATGLLGAEKL